MGDFDGILGSQKKTDQWSKDKKTKKFRSTFKEGLAPARRNPKSG